MALFGLWDSKGSRQVPTGQAECTYGGHRGKGVGRVQCEAMENDFWTALKRFLTTIQHLRRRKQDTVNTVYRGEGVLLTSTQDFVDRSPM